MRCTAFDIGLGKGLKILAALVWMIAAASPAALAGTVRGTVMLGPMCGGPARPGTACADRPVAARVDIFRTTKMPTSADTPFQRTQSDMRGHFELSLPPGGYWFVARPQHKPPAMLSARPSRVDVNSSVTVVRLVLDTGRR